MREQLLAEGLPEDNLLDGLPGQGWDFMTRANEVAFVAAVPAGRQPSSRRPSELRAASNARDRYREHEIDV